MTPEQAHVLGAALAAIDPWARFGTQVERLQGFLATVEANAPRFQVRYGGEVAGVIVVRHPWLHGPYLNLLGLLPAYQARGIGARLLDWFEVEARGQFRNLWLCVSSYNTGAQRFYATHGYEVAACLDALVKDGFDEILMRKRLG
jgi:ribosomal protein S18 acetylase RimI-like enzyme